MLVDIDVKKMSQAQVKELLVELVVADVITYDVLLAVQKRASEMDKSKDEAKINAIIHDVFEEYDEVFRKLA